MVVSGEGVCAGGSAAVVVDQDGVDLLVWVWDGFVLEQGGLWCCFEAMTK